MQLWGWLLQFGIVKGIVHASTKGFCLSPRLALLAASRWMIPFKLVGSICFSLNIMVYRQNIELSDLIGDRPECIVLIALLSILFTIYVHITLINRFYHLTLYVLTGQILAFNSPLQILESIGRTILAGGAMYCANSIYKHGGAPEAAASALKSWDSMDESWINICDRRGWQTSLRSLNAIQPEVTSQIQASSSDTGSIPAVGSASTVQTGAVTAAILAAKKP